MPKLLYVLFGPPLLLFVSVPLAAFAALTSSLAFSALILRVVIVYTELGLGLLRGWLSASPAPTPSSSPSLSAPTTKQAPYMRRRSSISLNDQQLQLQQQQQRRRHHRRKSSGASITLPSPKVSSSPQDLFPPSSASASTSASAPQSSQASTQQLPTALSKFTKSGSFASLTGGGPNRDFEGVGGWRDPGSGDDEAIWIGMNSRLELPAAGAGAAAGGPASADGESRRRHHRRSRTLGSSIGGGGGGGGGAGIWRGMSPVQSRARTPTASSSSSTVGEIGGQGEVGGGYFPLQPQGGQQQQQQQQEKRRGVSPGGLTKLTRLAVFGKNSSRG